MIPSEVSQLGRTWWITRPATPASTARATRATTRRSHTGAPGRRAFWAGRPGTAGVTPVSTTAKGTWAVLECTPSAPVATEVLGAAGGRRETAITGTAPVLVPRAAPAATGELATGACTTTTGPELSGVAGHRSINERA